jgi:hypothetical protein
MMFQVQLRSSRFQVPGSRLEVGAFFNLELGTWNVERVL